MTETLSLFIVDDDVGFVHAAAELARQEGYEITVAGSLAQARARLQKSAFDLALIDLSLPDGSGLDLLEHMDLCQRTQVIVITGNPTVESALKALHLPIVDYVVKPLHASRFRELLETAASRRRLPVPHATPTWHGLAGHSEGMEDVRRQICRVAPTEASVLIEGECGAGKELVAHAIHVQSGREGPFLTINCHATDADELGNLLFGHEAGCGTDKDGPEHAGLFEQSKRGTLFLEEITGMPAALQSQLLCALKSRSIRRAGASEDVPINVRVIAATHRPHADAIRDGVLREDLYYRLAEFPISIPPLRDRPEDIVVTADLFLQRLNERYGTKRSFAAHAAEQLTRYPWPGNLRELKNVVQRAYILADGDTVMPALPDPGNEPALAETANTITFAVGTPLHEMERRMLFKTLAYYDNNKARTAQALGITTKTIYNRLTAYQAQSRDSKEKDDALRNGESR